MGTNHREKLKAGILTVILGSGLMVIQASAGETPLLGAEKDKVNYSIGVNIIRSIKQQGIEIDLDLVMQGMKDSYSGGKLLLSDDEIRKGIDQYQIAVRQKHSQISTKAKEENKKAGETFLAANMKKQGVVTLPSGLQYEVLRVGEGKKPMDADTVECNYRGTFIDGTEFESSYRTGTHVAFKMNAVIPGWREALKLMPVGSTWRIFIPSQLAYGEQGSGQIGPNATLIFVVELLRIM